MAKEEYHDIPRTCPITGEQLYISELTAEKSGITIRGKFKVPLTAALDEENQRILDVFLRSRGVFSTMEKELGLSYPTVRARVDTMLAAMGLEPIKTEKKESVTPEEKRKILQQLEDGAITPEEAKTKLRGTA
ncbi:MAG: DUF2089 domain-containing protein [Armatimonadetes bacterium]|nr:DUF2089 domain-containing protein [Armatimonadota bacterium]